MQRIIYKEIKQVRSLSLHICSTTLTITIKGRSPSYYVSQLVQEKVKHLIGSGFVIKNKIEVV
jgi:hypothetical protein